MSIVDTPEKDLSNGDRKLNERILIAYSIKSLSTLLPCSIRAMYNRVHSAQIQRITLKSYIPAINKSNFPKKHYEHIFSEKMINELNAWIENHPHVIHSPNV